MTTPKTPPAVKATASKPRSAAAQARSAAALRDNLLRRKAQSRARAAETGDTAAPSPPPDKSST